MNGRKVISEQITLQEYFKQEMANIQATAGAEQDFCEVQFTSDFCDFLVEEAVISSYDAAFLKKTRQGIRIDAWDFNIKRKELSLFITDYSHNLELRTLSNSDVDTLFKRAVRFFNKAVLPKFLDEIDETSEIYMVARNIYENVDNIEKIQFYLLTNATLSERFKQFQPIQIEGYRTVFDIWDISRRFRIFNSGKAKEDILIDFSENIPGGIKYLEASIDEGFCSSFLLVFPGQLLYNIYDKYGDRLLEQNVRTFLQFRGNVNKGIRNTLKNQPEMFFAFNNGLTITAESLNIKDNRIISAKNLQIVNGGQTTASIFMSKLMEKNSIELNNVHVQVKLSVINPEKVDEIVPLISKSSNTQNKIQTADFFSNHPFHKRIEDFSRRVLAPASESQLAETYWFYERARGQYANQQSRLTQSNKKKFLTLHPKPQMFNKTDLAKFENCFNEMPHFVCKGAQWNFGKFAEEITGKDSKDGLWDTNEDGFNELWFKNLISKAILFRYLEKNMMKQDWYGGFRAQIIAYTLSKFSHEVNYRGQFIDFNKIWMNQNVSKNLSKELMELASDINFLITDTEENPTQYCKKEACWNKIKKEKYSFKYDLSNDFLDSDIVSDLKIDAKKKQKVLKGIDLQIEVINKGQEYWTSLYNYCFEKKFLTEKQSSILVTTLRIDTNPPSEKQCKIILQIEQMAITEGFYQS